MINERMQELAGVTLTEAGQSDAEKLSAGIEKSFKKYFKDSSIYVGLQGGLGYYVYVQFALGKNKSEWGHNIFENDPMATKVLIHDFEKDGRFAGKKYTADNATGGSLMVKPPPNSYLAFGRVKVWRKFSSPDLDKFIVQWDKYFKKLRTAVKDNVDNFVRLEFDPRKKI